MIYILACNHATAIDYCRTVLNINVDSPGVRIFTTSSYVQGTRLEFGDKVYKLPPPYYASPVALDHWDELLKAWATVELTKPQAPFEKPS